MVENEKVDEIVVVTSKNKPVNVEEAQALGIRVVDSESSEGKEIAGKEPEGAFPKAYMLMKTARACEIMKENGKIIAKCGDKKVDLQMLNSIEAAEKVQGKTDEECPTCGSAIAVGWAINYVKPLNSLIANRIYEDVTDEKITPDEAMDKCIQLAQQHGKADLVDTLQGLKEMMHKPLSELEKEAENGPK